MSVDQGGWRWQMEVLQKQFPGLTLVSGFRNNSITATGNTSYHSKGLAVDVPPRMDVFEWIRTNYPDSAELIYSPAGNRQIWNGKPHLYTGVTRAQHFDHVHWAYTKPGTAANPVPATGADGSGASNPLGPLVAAFQFLFSPGLFLRVGAAIAGGALILLGFLALTGRRMTTIVGK